MYGIPAFYLAAKEEELNAIIGVELGFILDLKASYLVKQMGNICLLAATDEGYYNLMKIVSFASKEGLEGKPKIDLGVLQKYNEGLIIFYGGIESWI